MIGPDEPRYAAIGRAMAQTGDWVTPKLWSSPWFEKPPAIYWTTALASRAGLGMETAPRLPVALLGFSFVVFFYFLVRREFGPTEALYATAVLGTSAGWLTYSYVAVTDIPLSVFFCASLLLTFEWISGGEGSPARALTAGALLGLAVLAKGLVPLVLFAPVVWPMRRKLSHLALIGGACIMVAAPWYIECTFRNGNGFLNEFFWKHHFERFTSDSLQHVRPFWFYLPVLLGAVFPWTPLLVLVRPGLFRDARLRFAGLWLIYALVFFSASRNKLPGYLIPTLPAACLILGIALGWARRTRLPLFFCALLLALSPAVAAMLPEALGVGLSRTPWHGFDLRWSALFAVLALGPLVLEIRTWRTEALALAAVSAAAAFMYIKQVALPATDRVRPFYAQHAAGLDGVCLHDVGRDARYGLQYYAGREFPVCESGDLGPMVMEVGSRLILLD
jgi:4-amino-4-deoxy-L-arabinose transferase-like glycosyltransferase